ncbi:UDP-N-acetylglucosamine 1-carboxyvinyltransferase MurA [Mycobacterium tuberculosis '98-R604 INH-RIF-EM']|nr:UDP-N-acetylglucosamine 1-carboxyvinyltransferase MurA [Mycobacterium tuberculosis '98-R604 INH-RIF-EM']
MDMHRRATAIGCPLQHRARLRGSPSGNVARCGDSVGVPLGGSHREHLDGRRGGRGSHHYSQCGSRTRRRRLVHDVEPDGRTGRRCGFADNDHHRCPAAASNRAPGDRRPYRCRHMGHRCRNDPW